MLGNKEALAIAGGVAAVGHAGALPALPPVPDTANWIPLMREGSPEAIAAWVRYLLSQAEHGDWDLQEEALCWLDRLCFHQHVFEIPGGAPLGLVGSGDAWYVTSLWMPSLLLHAYRLTGMPEYAFRARAALCALAPADQARVIQQLSPRFGDIYLHADYGEAFALGPVEFHGALCTPNVISLEITRTLADAPLTLVAEGVMEPCRLSVNGQMLGVILPEQFAAGIALP